MPLTDFWNRWRRKLPQPERQDSAPTLLEAEKQRRGTTRQAAKELATIVTMPPRARSRRTATRVRTDADRDARRRGGVV